MAVNLSYDYDHMGRKLHTWQGINGSTILLNAMTYNEVGQLAEKNLHSANSGQSFVQSVDYRYNSRGWLKSINNATLNNSDPLINNDNNDVFGEELAYDDYATPALKQYNGNISAVSWQGKKQVSATADLQGYEYSYDKLNRLTLANYTTAGLTGRYNEAITYDAMGNIKKLNRYRDISNAATPIDQLTYLYDNGDNSSKLLSVTDVSGSNEGQLNGTAGYTYDNNGNLWVDNKKGLTFTYNHLNLPYTVTPTTGSVLTYIYDATGRKLRKGLSGGNRDYVNGIEYDGSGAIAFIQTEEGRARPNGGSSYFYDYALKDHLGNTRVLIGQDGQISQQTDYYAFGMQMNRGSNTVPSPDHKYKYNGKELQDELNMNLYDYGARFYDPVIGRWTSVDPLAEKNRRLSPYNYGINNPIRFIDPDGMDVYSDDQQQDKKREKDEQEQKEEVGADGLTMNQWVAASNPAADSELGDYFRADNQNSTNRDTTKKSSGKGSKANQGGLKDITSMFDKQLAETRAFFTQQRKQEEEDFGDLRTAPNVVIADRYVFFANMVKTGAKYDLKNQGYKRNVIGYYSLWHGEKMQFGDYGQINYGVAAKAYGISLEDAIHFAGINQIIQLKPNWSNTRGWFDGPGETELIIRGYNMFK